MHPIEHLRYVARAEGADPAVVAREAGEALVQMARSEPGLVLPSAKALIDRHPTAAPVWWLAARMLREDDPVQAGRRAMEELDEDQTPARVADALPDGATVVVLGWPDVISEGLRMRGDVEVLVVESKGEGYQFARRLQDRDCQAELVVESGVGSAAMVADLVLLECLAAGPGGIVAVPGSLAAAAVAAHRRLPVWAVAGAGRVLPAELWDALTKRLDESGREPWDRNVDVVPAGLIDQVIDAQGAHPVAEGLASSTCPPAPELFRPVK
jgi:translation initiation factor 2B subunit (eIF-2B alpha/beta/delta family)